MYEEEEDGWDPLVAAERVPKPSVAPLQSLLAHPLWQRIRREWGGVQAAAQRHATSNVTASHAT